MFHFVSGKLEGKTGGGIERRIRIEGSRKGQTERQREGFLNISMKMKTIRKEFRV
jgi:hypothetical protein